MINSLSVNASGLESVKQKKSILQRVRRCYSRQFPILKLALVSALLLTTVAAYAQKTTPHRKAQLLQREADFQKSSPLNKLVYGGRPTLYIHPDKTRMTDGDSPQVVDIDAAAIADLTNSDTRFASSKLLIINIKTESDKQIKLKESQLKSFQKLEHILFSSQINISENEIQNMFTARANSKIKTHYRILAIAR